MNSSSKALVLCAVAAWPAAAKTVEDQVGTVNGSPIMLTEFNKEYNAAVEYWNKVNPGALSNVGRLKELREKTLEQLIDHELLFQEGGKLKIKVRERDVDTAVDEIKKRSFAKDETGKTLTDAEADALFAKQLKNEGLSETQFRERLSKQVMARKVLDQEVKAKVNPPSDKEVQAYFEKIKAYIAAASTETPKGMEEDEALAFRDIALQVKDLSSERVRVSRILVKFSPGAPEPEKKRALKTAKEIKKKLEDGSSSFAELAKTESEDLESAPLGGDIGFIVRGRTLPEIEKAAFALPVGEISEPIATDFGYNLLRVSEKRAAEAPDFDKFKDQLAQFLANLNGSKEVEKYIKGLKDKAVIERNLPAL